MRVFVSWSGGKDSCLAHYRALRAGLEPSFLLTVLDEEGTMSRSHGVGAQAIDAQAEAMGIPIVYARASWEDYERKFEEAAGRLKALGVKGGVFGDVNLREHKDWVERVCAKVGIRAFEPLWGESYEKLLNEFLESGFEATVVSVKEGLISEDWLGRKVDKGFIEALKENEVDLLGENGEYHTLVTYGPTFKKRVEVRWGRKLRSEGRRVLEVLEVSLV